MTKVVWIVSWVASGKLHCEVFNTEAEAKAYYVDHNIFGNCCKGAYHASTEEV